MNVNQSIITPNEILMNYKAICAVLSDLLTGGRYVYRNILFSVSIYLFFIFMIYLFKKKNLKNRSQSRRARIAI